jgi:hypothetical protein
MKDIPESSAVSFSSLYRSSFYLDFSYWENFINRLTMLLLPFSGSNEGRQIRR